MLLLLACASEPPPAPILEPVAAAPVAPPAVAEPAIVAPTPAPPAEPTERPPAPEASSKSFPRLEPGIEATVSARLPPLTVTEDSGDIPADLAMIQKKHRARVQTCVERSWMERPELVGRVAVELSIVDAKVDTSVLTENTTGHAALGECFARILRTVRFAPGTTTTVTWAWRLPEH